MNQHKQTLDSIINTFISKSKKNSHDHHSFNSSKDTPDQTVIQYTNNQEYIILEQDLKQFVQKMAATTYQRDNMIQNLSKTNKQLQNHINLAEGRIAVLTQLNNSNILTEQKQSIYKKNLSQLSVKYDTEKKRREKLQKQIQWGNGKIKEHICDIEKLKQRIANQDIQIARLSQIEKEKINKSGISFEVKQTSRHYITPAKLDTTSKQPSPPSKSIIPSQFYTDFVARETQECPKHILQTGKTRDSQKEQNNISFLKINSFDKEKPQLYQQEKNAASKINRLSEYDPKDRLLKMLGEKCLFLQSHIETLTKKILGYIIPESPSRQNIKKIEQGSNRFIKGGNQDVRQCLVNIQNEDDMPDLDLD